MEESGRCSKSYELTGESNGDKDDSTYDLS